MDSNFQAQVQMQIPQGETKICKKCKSIIDKKAKVCPFCRKKQGGKLKWFIIGFIVICIIATAIGGDNNNNSGSHTADGSTETSTPGAEESSTPEDVSIQEQVLLDQDGIKITATGLDANVLYTDVLVKIENNSDKTIMVQTRNESINGYMLYPSFSCDVEVGKIANDRISFSTSDLKECGIETVSDIQFYFNVMDYDTWADIIISDTVTINTTATGYTQNYDDSGDVIFEGDGIRIISKGLYDDSVLGSSLKVYIENNSGQNIMVQTRNTSVNGIMVEPTFSADIVDGKVILDELTFWDSDFEENGIEDVKSIETSFTILRLEDWSDIVDTGPITINIAD